MVNIARTSLLTDSVPTGRFIKVLRALGPVLLALCCIYAVRLVLIARYGNITPYWDQWDAEADLLYRPWLTGELKWTQLFAPHNEHRIFFSRVLSLLLLWLGGDHWSPLLQMRVNALIHMSALGIVASLLGGSLRAGYRAAFLVFLVLLFAIPFDWENVLVGFQSQFYFLLLFTFPSLWLLSSASMFSARWWAGVALAVFSFLTMASGAFTLLAGAAVSALRASLEPNARGRNWLGATVLFVLGIAAVLLTPMGNAQDGFKARGLAELLGALVRVLSWPLNESRTAFLALQLPAVLFLVTAWIRRRRDTALAGALPFFFAVAVWVLGQMVATAYGRAAYVYSPRYLSLYAVGILFNSYALLLLVQQGFARRWLVLVGALWACLVITGFWQSRQGIEVAMRDRAAQGATQEHNVRAYLQTGDDSSLRNKRRLDIPYPDPDRLKMLLDDPIIRRILPTQLLP